MYIVLCRDGVFIEPEGGWKKEGRVYIAMKDGGHANSRFGIFEYYRQRIRGKESGAENVKQRKTINVTKYKGKDTAFTNIKVTHGHFKHGVFSKISCTNLSGLGGCVVVGPFPKSGNTADDIREEAFKKFCCVNSGFKRRYRSKDDFYLVYQDGKIVKNLPDDSDEFSLQGYRDFLDPQKRYDRLRLFLCEKQNFDVHNNTEVLSDCSSSSDELPNLTVPIHRRPVSNEPSTSSLNDTIFCEVEESLPLVINVLFRFGDKTFEQSFPNNSKAKTLFLYVNNELKNTARLRMGDRYVSPDDRLLQLASTNTLELSVEIERDVVVPASYNEDVDDSLFQDILTKMDSIEEPTLILRKYQQQFLQGRDLDCTDHTETIDGATSVIYIGRYTLWEDMLREIEMVENIRPVGSNILWRMLCRLRRSQKRIFDSGNEGNQGTDNNCCRRWYFLEV